ncbi:MAG: phage tail length tape measure family protein [Novosphingobium sp.]|nr:phage tail length tape measure family protein [Novosphingobium sp.]
MAIKLNLVFAGDSSGAEAALASVDKGLNEAAAEAKRLAAAMDAADKSIEQLAAAQTRAKTETVAAKVALKAGSITAQEYNVRLLETKTALALVESGHRSAVNALKQAQNALGGAKVSSGQAAAGYQNFGRQVQDVAVQLQGGANLGTIISQQGGQIADAVAMMGGRAAGFASFMAGPWGALITVGTGVLVNLGIEAANAGAEMDKVKFASNALGDAQGILGNVLDITTGKIKTQSSALIALARAQIIAGQIEAKKRQAEAQSAITASAGFRTEFGGGLGGGFSVTRRQGAEAQVESNFRNGIINTDQAIQQLDRLRKAGSITEEKFVEMAQAYANFGVEQANLDVFKSAEKLLNGKGGRELLKPEKSSTKGTKDELGKLQSFADQVRAKVAGINDEFAELPTQVEKSNAATRQLDLILASVEKRKGLSPAVVTKLRQEIEATRDTIENSLNKPFNDYIEKAQQAAEIDKLLLAGREDEARALQIVLGLQEKQGPLQKEQLQAVLETVQKQREMSMVLRDQGALIDANINAVRDFRGALTGTVADMLRGRLSVERILASIGNSYITIMSQKIVEGIFGDTLRKLEAQASGADKVDAAGNRIASSLDKGGKAVEDFGSVVARVSAEISGGRTGGSSVGSLAEAASGAAGSLGSFLDKITSGLVEKVAQRASGGVPEATGDEIVVTANKNRKVDLSGTGEMLINLVDQSLRRFGIVVPKVLTESLKGVFSRFEQALPNAMRGAFTGAAASKLILGNGGSSIGGAIGGAIGQKMGEKFLSSGLEKVGGKLLGSVAGPLGGIVGGILGGALGGLFKSTKTGGASIGLDAQGNAGITGTGGNSADLKKTASGYAGTVVSALDQIAQALGAELGNFAVAIGKRSSGYIKVDSTGNVGATTAKKRGANIIYDGKDEGEAIMAALANAISDGAIAGVSAAVQKALKSSTDVDKALKEALKVQDVELLIGGIGAEMEKAFREFESQAKERLRIGREYGFDLAKLEERNAADRLKLQEKLLRDQVGSLQDLIEEMTAGSLFEGSAVDQRQKLLEEIATVRVKASAGEDGAADKLTQLLQKLNEVSKEAYGTTGGFASDRQTILDAARDTIAKANQRVTQAQAISDPAVVNALDENNDQNARMLAELGLNNEYLRQFLGSLNGRAGITGLAQLARTS